MIIESMTGQVGTGGVVGLIFGMILRKVLLLIALVSAFGIASLGYFDSQGYVNVNWGFFDASGSTEAASTVAQSIVGVGTELILNLLMSIPAGAGFTGGAIIGFTRG